MSQPCGAKTRSGNPCKLPGTGAGGRCKFHGGATPGGALSANFKHGRYSKYIPKRLAERFQEAASDPEILNLTADIALIDARIAEMLDGVEVGAGKDIFFRLQDAYTAFERAQQGHDLEASKAALLSIKRLVTQGIDEQSTWDQVHLLLEQRRRFVADERRRRVEMAQMIDAESAMTLAQALAAAVKENVNDPKILASINVRFRQLLNTE